MPQTKPRDLEALLEDFNPENFLETTGSLGERIDNVKTSEEVDRIKVHVSLALVQVLVAIHTDLLIIGDQIGTYLDETEVVEEED